jgi:putative copper resistance protein D
LSRRAEASQFRETVESFGRRAQWIVAFLAAAGVTLFIVLSGGTIDPANPYQQRFGLKLLLVCAILGLAAINKFSLTPQLQSKDSDQARAALSKSIVLESCLAAAILLATAVMLAHAPAVD